jgi:hypothetical protein
MVAVDHALPCGYKFLTHAVGSGFSSRHKADRGVRVILLATRIDGTKSPPMSPVLGDALQNAGYEIQWVSSTELERMDVQGPTVIMAELETVETLITRVPKESVVWLPVLVDPSASALAAARSRFGQVVVAPGKLSQVVGLVDALAEHSRIIDSL